jgi:hypothetical protein
MPVARNRVTPFGSIEDLPGRGLFMGNRGSIHEGREIRRQWTTKAWITCALEFKGWRAPMWEPGRWTPLFFLDEATALAAGHRPCALCRRAEYNQFREAFADVPLKEVDATLHRERLTTQRPTMAEPDVPDGAMVSFDGRAWLKCLDTLLPWTSEGYGPPRRSPRVLTVITPPSTVDAIRNGYVPRVHGTAL